LKTLLLRPGIAFTGKKPEDPACCFDIDFRTYFDGMSLNYNFESDYRIAS